MKVDRLKLDYNNASIVFTNGNGTLIKNQYYAEVAVSANATRFQLKIPFIGSPLSGKYNGHRLVTELQDNSGYVELLGLDCKLYESPTVYTNISPFNGDYIVPGESIIESIPDTPQGLPEKPLWGIVLEIEPSDSDGFGNGDIWGIYDAEGYAGTGSRMFFENMRFFRELVVTSGNFIVPADYTSINIDFVFGGGGNGGLYSGRGGGGGGVIEGATYPVTPLQTIPYSITAQPGSTATFGVFVARGGENEGAGGSATDGTVTAAGGDNPTQSGGGYGGDGEQVASVYGGILYGGGGGGFGGYSQSSNGGSGYAGGGAAPQGSEGGGGGGGGYDEGGYGGEDAAKGGGGALGGGGGGSGIDWYGAVATGGGPGAIIVTFPDISGWTHKIMGISPSKVMGIVKASIKKIMGV